MPSFRHRRAGRSNAILSSGGTAPTTTALRYCSFCDLFAQFGYTLVCCNAATGVNAFFVKDAHMPAFKDVPQNIGDIFVQGGYWLPVRFVNPASSKTIEQMLSGPAEVP
jgi:hypothetical protein